MKYQKCAVLIKSQTTHSKIIDAKDGLEILAILKEFTLILNKQSIYFIHPNSDMGNKC